MEDKPLSEQEKETPRVEERDYKAEYYELLEYINDIGFQLQLQYRNIKATGLKVWKEQNQIQP